MRRGLGLICFQFVSLSFQWAGLKRFDFICLDLGRLIGPCSKFLRPTLSN